MGFIITLFVLGILCWIIQIIILWSNAAELNEAIAKKGQRHPYSQNYFENKIKMLWWVRDPDIRRLLLIPYGFPFALHRYIKGPKEEKE